MIYALLKRTHFQLKKKRGKLHFCPEDGSSGFFTLAIYFAMILLQPVPPISMPLHNPNSIPPIPQWPYFESEGGRFLYTFYRHLAERLDLKHFYIEFLTPNFVLGDEKRRIIFPAKINPHVASEIVVICLHHGVTDVVSMNLSPLSLLYIITARC